MTVLPDFSAYGYQVTEQLNHNVQGGRITYKAVAIATKKPVTPDSHAWISFIPRQFEGNKVNCEVI